MCLSNSYLTWPLYNMEHFCHLLKSVAAPPRRPPLSPRVWSHCIPHRAHMKCLCPTCPTLHLLLTLQPLSDIIYSHVFLMTLQAPFSAPDLNIYNCLLDMPIYYSTDTLNSTPQTELSSQTVFPPSCDPYHRQASLASLSLTDTTPNPYSILLPDWSF